MTVEQETREGTVVPLDVTVSDICDPNPAITSNELDIYPPGTTTVTFTATDASGNSASCSVNVTVSDIPTFAITIISPEEGATYKTTSVDLTYRLQCRPTAFFFISNTMSTFRTFIHVMHGQYDIVQ